MRNLKRALSLTLASVMLLGMMVAGAGAAGFPDVDDDNANIEAIEVLQAIEVMVGNADTGNFEPDRSVTRSEMAVVMANLLNLDYQYYEANCPFWDVPTWAKPYVGACYANKIVSGYGDGTYGALDTVTAVQAASMMMRALGYFQHSEDYEAGFETATVRQGTQIGIFEGVGSSATAPMTRGQVARMALNALESEMVSFTGTPGTTYTTSTGESLSIGYRAEYTPRTSTEIKYQAIEQRTSDVSGGNNLNRGQYYIQLGEELYNGKLTKRYARDDFERPSINWQYNGKDIGTYVDYDLLVVNGSYTTGVKFSELYDLLTYTTINENDVLRFEDGVSRTIDKKDFNRSNKDEVGGTGALTEVFLDQERDEIIITTINTYLAKANSDYNKTNETLSLKVYVENEKGMTKVVDSAEVPEAENVAKDEYRLVYLSGKDSGAAFEGYTRYDVVNIFDIEIMEAAEITKWSKSAPKVVGKLTTGGTEYSSNRKAYYDYGNVLDDYDLQLLSDMTYNIYMDRYGNVIGVDLHEGNLNYVFITGYDRGKSNISVKTADAAAIFTDGTMDTITVNVSDTNKNIRSAKAVNAKEPDAYREYDEWTLNAGGNQANGGDRNLNRWYTYTVSANGNYTLKPIKNFMFTAYGDSAFDKDGVKVLDCANLFLDDSSAINKLPVNSDKGRVYGEDDSIYITVDTSYVDTSGTNVPGGASDDNDAITEVEGVYTGAQDIKIELTKDTKGKVNNDKDKDAELQYAQETLAEQNAYVYTIFDNDNYIIASIVMGDAQGAAANYVYVLDGAKNERVERASSSRASSGDTYYWEFDAVVDGEITTLTVKEKYSSTLKNDLNIYGIVEIRYDGDYVVDIKNVDDDDIFYYWTEEGNKLVQSGEIEDKDVYDVGNSVGYSWTKDTSDWRGVGQIHNTVLMDKGDKYAYNYNKIDRVEGTIYLQGRTLYVDNAYTSDRDIGLGLARDAKAVLVQPENGKLEKTGCGTVQEAIDRLSDRNPETTNPGIQFKGRIAAVLDGRGVAKWVVIISDTNLVTGNTPDYGTNDILRWSNYEQAWELDIPWSEYRDWETQGTSVVYRWLVKAGCSNVEKTTTGWDFTFKGVYNKDQKVIINWIDRDDEISSVTLTAPDTVNVGGEVSVTTSRGSVLKTECDTSKAGSATLEVTVTAPSGYVFASSLKITGWTVSVASDGKSFTASKTVTVEDDTPENEVKINPVAGSYVTTVADQDKMISSAGKDVKIVAWPAQAVEITKGATKNADGSYTVTGDEPVQVSIKKDAEGNALWSFNEDQKAWAGGDPIQFISMKNTPLYATARMARAVVTGDWLDEALSNPDKTYTLTVTDEEKVYTWEGATTSSGVIGELPVFTLTPDATSNTAAARRAFLAAWAGGEGAPSLKVEDNEGEDPKPVDPEVIVKSTTTKANTGWSAVFTKYIPEKLADEETLVLNKAEVEKALAEELGGVWTADIKKGEAVRESDKQKVTFGANPSAQQMYMVTYPGATGKVSVYVNPLDAKTCKVENVNKDVTYLLAKDDVYAADPAYTVANQEVTFTGVSEDVEYIAALMLESTGDWAVTGGHILNKAAGKTTEKVLKAEIKKSAVDFEDLDKTTTAYVQVGTTITFAQGADVKTGVDALKAGEGVKLEVNGSSTAALEFVANDKGVIATKEWKVPEKAKNSTLSFKAIREPVDQEISVYLNDSTTALPTETIDKEVYVKIGDVNIGDGSQYSVVYWDDANEKYDLVNTKISPNASVVVDTAGVARVKRGALSAIATTDANGNKVAKIYTAYSVAPGGAWDGYLDNPNDETKNVTAIAGTAYVPTNSNKIWVKATGAALLMDKNGSGELSGRILPTPTVDGTVKAVYAYTVTKNLITGDIVPALTFASTTVKGNLNADLKAGVESTACTITNLTIGSAGQKIKLDLGPAVTVTNAAGSLADAGAVTFTLGQSKLDGTVTFTAKSVNDAPRSLKAETNVGKATVTINGVTIIIDIDRDKRTAGITDEDKVAFIKSEFESLTVAPIAKAEPIKTDADIKAAVATAVSNNSELSGGTYSSVLASTHSGVIGNITFAGAPYVETIQAVANGTKEKPDGERGEYKVYYAVISNSVKDVAYVTVYLEAMPYDETTDGIAEAAALAKINAVKAALLDADTGLKELTVTKASKDDALVQLKTDIGTVITKLGSDVTGVTVKAATAEDADFQAPADPAKGSLTATVTLECSGCDDVNFNITVDIPAT